MGKSRHMKEVANHLPCVYICLRNEGIGFGYPRRSPDISNWSMEGVITVVGRKVTFVEFDFCFSTFRWSAFILSTIRKLTTWISDGRFFTSLGIDSCEAREFKYAWLWNFFAEPPNSGELKEFWNEVESETLSMLHEHLGGKKAYAYFQRRMRLMFGRPWSNFENVSWTTESTISRYR
jgi:hypothetical protein